MPNITTDAVRRVLAEDVITLKEAGIELEPVLKRRVDKTTLYRWCLKGCRGVILDHCRVGNQILTSKQALHRFIDERSR